MKEKRRLERFDLSVPARLEGLGRGRQGDIIHLQTSDICSGGAFFQTEQSLPEGTKVRIEIVLPLRGLKKFLAEYEHAQIQVTGTVVRNESRGMAVCFNKDYAIKPWKGREPSRH
jgi:hypothetical protein